MEPPKNIEFQKRLIMFHAINGQTNVNGEVTDYIRFGKGKHYLVMIPGVGDGLKTVKGMALPFALLYRNLTKDFTVYVFSRPVNLKPKTSTEDMAESLFKSMKSVGINKAFIVGVSQGGMIAQHLTLKYPDLVAKLVLVVTLSHPNPTVNSVISRWLEMAERDDYKSIMLSTAELSYTPQKLKSSKHIYNIISNLGKPKSLERFIIQANSCITHNTYERLSEIQCPTLVIGGSEDKIVTGEASKEIAEKIVGAELLVYEGFGHGLYEEAKDFLKVVSSFLLDK